MSKPESHALRVSRPFIGTNVQIPVLEEANHWRAINCLGILRRVFHHPGN
jgi:hypothetical protein